MSVDAKIDALSAKLDQLVSLLAKVPAFSAALAGASSSAAAAEDDGSQHPSVLAFSDFVSQHVQPFFDVCKRVEGLNKTGELAEKAYEQLKTVLRAAAICKKPTMADLQKFAAPLVEVSQAAAKAIDNRSQYFPHLNSFAEYIAALGWIFITPTPMGHVQAQLESADFYLNKILLQFKGQDDHKLFVTSIKSSLKEMQVYIKAFHTTGLTWNAAGKDLKDFGSAKPAAAAAPAPGPGPAVGPAVGPGPMAGPPLAGPPVGIMAGPPASVSVPPPADAPADASSGAAGMSAVFASINAGHSTLVGGLRHVTKDMKVKNQPAAEPVAPKAAPKPAAAAAPKPAAAPKGEPKMYEKQGKWFIENYEGGQVELPADQVNQKQNVYIYKCNNTLVQIPAKCKAICIDSCNKTNVIFSSVVSTLELVNCKSVGVEIRDSAPSVAIDKAVSIQVYLSQSAVDVRPNIVTSNITAVNVVVPGRNPEDDPIEIPIPEQYVSTFKDAFNLVHGCLEHKSG